MKKIASLKLINLLEYIHYVRSTLKATDKDYVRLGQILEIYTKDRSQKKKEFTKILNDEYPELLL